MRWALTRASCPFSSLTRASSMLYDWFSWVDIWLNRAKAWSRPARPFSSGASLEVGWDCWGTAGIMLSLFHPTS